MKLKLSLRNLIALGACKDGILFARRNKLLDRTFDLDKIKNDPVINEMIITNLHKSVEFGGNVTFLAHIANKANEENLKFDKDGNVIEWYNCRFEHTPTSITCKFVGTPNDYDIYTIENNIVRDTQSFLEGILYSRNQFDENGVITYEYENYNHHNSIVKKTDDLIHSEHTLIFRGLHVIENYVSRGGIILSSPFMFTLDNDMLLLRDNHETNITVKHNSDGTFSYIENDYKETIDGNLNVITEQGYMFNQKQYEYTYDENGLTHIGQIEISKYEN